jgi:hypothetical protein
LLFLCSGVVLSAFWSIFTKASGIRTRLTSTLAH